MTVIFQKLLLFLYRNDVHHNWNKAGSLFLICKSRGRHESHLLKQNIRIFYSIIENSQIYYFSYKASLDITIIFTLYGTPTIQNTTDGS